MGVCVVSPINILFVLLFCAGFVLATISLFLFGENNFALQLLVFFFKL